MKKAENASVRIIPLGGLEQIGMNITAIEYDDSIVVVDCGLSFPEEDMLGIDLVIPDVTYLKENLNKVKGFVITHGHENGSGGGGKLASRLDVPDSYESALEGIDTDATGLTDVKINASKITVPDTDKMSILYYNQNQVYIHTAGKSLTREILRER